MTSKEKAFELVNKYHFVKIEKGKTSIGIALSFENAKKCALICIDELLSDFKESKEVCKDLHKHADGLITGSIVFWEEVKHCITFMDFERQYDKWRRRKHQF